MAARVSRVEELRARIQADLVEAEARVAELRAELAAIGYIATPIRHQGDTRTAIVSLLMNGPRRMREIVRLVPASYSAVTAQLSRGARSGHFVRSRVDGDVIYSLPPGAT